MANRELPELRSRLRLDTAEAESRAKASARRIIAAFDDPKAMAGLTGRIESFSNKADEFGSKMTRGVTLPVVAAGAASFKMASDFNTSFTQMQTLAGVTAGEVDGLKSSVMDLSGTTAQSPQELARALYFIRSAGIDGADAMAVLEASAKGSAIGLGETAGIADVVTSALNTYGSENLSAAQAVDVLSSAVAQGKGEAADFAPQLGNLLPIAQKLGVGFDQVAGSVAFLTQTNGDVARSSTAVAGVFQKLLAPTEQGAKVLEQYGLSAESVREYLAENGLIATLQMLDEKLGGNSDQLRKVFDDIEGFNGVLGLLRNGGSDAAAVIDEVSQSAGYLDGAFQKVNQTDEFKFQQALADLQATAIQVGQDLIPIFTDVASAIGGIASGFTSLPEPIQTGIIALAAMAAILGPVAKGASLAADGVGLLIKVAKSESMANFALGLSGVTAQSGGTANALGGLIATAAASPVAWGAAAVGVGALVYAFTQMESQAEETEKAAKNLQAAAEATGSSIEEVFRKQLAKSLAGQETGSLDQSGGNVDAVARGIQAAKLDADELADALLGTQEQYDAMVAQAQAAADALLEGDPTGYDIAQAAAIEAAIGAFGRWREQGLQARGEQERLTEVEKALGIETSTATGAIEGQNGALDENADALGEAADRARALFDARQEVQSTAEAVTAAEGDLADAHQDTIDSERAAVEASRGVTEARKAAADADRAAADAARAIGEAQAAGARAIRDADLGVLDAERSLAEAQVASQLAQENLTQSRKDAVRSLEDLGRANRGDVLSEKEARLALKEAQKDLRRAKPSEREGAALRVERAQLALENAIVRAQDSTAELAARRAAGVEGSPEVTAAQGQVASTAQAEQEAERRLLGAQEAAADARVAAADRVRDAQDRLRDAQDRQREAGQRIVGARAAVVGAHDAVAEAAKREEAAAIKVKDAELKHVEAQGELAGLLFGNVGKIDVLVTKYGEIASTLDPNSPLRKNLEGYINDLRTANDLEAARLAVIGGPGQGGIPPTRDPDAGPRRSAPGIKATPKLTVPNASGRAAPRLVPAASGSTLPSIQVGPFHIDGNPDESALRQLERIAERAVETGLRKAATR